jgi:hypothetical protein
LAGPTSRQAKTKTKQVHDHQLLSSSPVGKHSLHAPSRDHEEFQSSIVIRNGTKKIIIIISNTNKVGDLHNPGI